MQQAVHLLQSDALFRSDKVLGPAQWLLELKQAIDNAPARKRNITWRYVATAPAGFCRPESTMIGTLLDDLEAGMPFEQVANRFRQKMDPLKYQRAQALPSAGNIQQAEILIEKLSGARALKRRFAREDELQPKAKVLRKLYTAMPKGRQLGMAYLAATEAFEKVMATKSKVEPTLANVWSNLPTISYENCPQELPVTKP